LMMGMAACRTSTKERALSIALHCQEVLVSELEQRGDVGYRINT
jgi:hypothetical protein